MAVKNHGVSEELVEAMFAQIAAFFALPTPEKHKILANKDFRGYTPMKVCPPFSRHPFFSLKWSSLDVEEGGVLILWFLQVGSRRLHPLFHRSPKMFCSVRDVPADCPYVSNFSSENRTFFW